MNWSGNTILVTGGSSGIGLELSGLLLERKNKVIVTGRRPRALDDARRRFPQLSTRISDASSKLERESLIAWVLEEHPDVNVLINNAGIQFAGALAEESWSAAELEIATNLHGPIHLSKLLLEHFQAKPSAHIVNVSSGLAFAPIARMAIYCATKAALHSFTLSLRHQLRDTAVGVTEIIPPAIKTGLGDLKSGVDLDEFARAVMDQLEDGRQEVTYGRSTARSKASRAELDHIFSILNQ